MDERNLGRRAFVMGAVSVGVLGGLQLVGCAPSQAPAEQGPEETQPEEGQAKEVVAWVDAVTTASVDTNKYTNLELDQVIESINASTVECMFSTTNEDGTPNLAVFAGGRAYEGGYITFNWTDNQTKANLKRSKLGMIGYDIVNLTAETKEERHQGARVKVELVEDEEERAKVMAMNEKITDATIIVKIVEVLPVG